MADNINIPMNVLIIVTINNIIASKGLVADHHINGSTATNILSELHIIVSKKKNTNHNIAHNIIPIIVLVIVTDIVEFGGILSRVLLFMITKE